ncbi:MAG: ZIP family metal transporter [Candidatus Paceibacteria bacterium]
MFAAVLGAGVVMVVSLLGVLFTLGRARVWFEKNLSFLVSFAGGVFLVTAGALTLEVLEIADAWWQGAGLIVVGYVLALVLHKLLPETHHHHGTDCHHTHRKAKKLIIGDAIHNVADGVVLVVAFSVSPALGLGVLLSVVIHEALQEVSEFFVLRQAGYSVKKALAINFAVSSTILIGVGLGYFALASHELEVLLLALSAGFFFNVVLHDLLPKRSEHGASWLSQIAVVAAGVLVMAGAQWVVGTGHEHGHGHSHGEEHSHADQEHDHNEDGHEHEDKHHDDH